MALDTSTPTDLIPDEDAKQQGESVLTWHVPAPDGTPIPQPTAGRQPHEKVAAFLSAKSSSSAQGGVMGLWQKFVKRFSSAGTHHAQPAQVSVTPSAPLTSAAPKPPAPPQPTPPRTSMPTPSTPAPTPAPVPARPREAVPPPVAKLPEVPAPSRVVPQSSQPAPIVPTQPLPSGSLVRAVPLPQRRTSSLAYTAPLHPEKHAPTAVAVSLSGSATTTYSASASILSLIALALVWIAGAALVVRAGHTLATDAQQYLGRAIQLEQEVAMKRAGREGGMSRARAVRDLAQGRFDWIDFLDKVRGVTVPGVVYARFSGTAYESVNLFVRAKDYATFVAQLRSYESAGFVKQRIIQGVRQRQIDSGSSIIESEIVLQLR